MAHSRAAIAVRSTASGRVLGADPWRGAFRSGVAAHPSSQDLVDLSLGECSPGAALLLSRHAEMCIGCRVRLSELGPPPAPVRLRLGDWTFARRKLTYTDVLGVSGLGERVCLVRLSPDAPLRLPRLRVDEMLVLEGHLFSGGLVLREGDYWRAPGPRPAEWGSGEVGCLCLVNTTSMERAAPLMIGAPAAAVQKA